MQAARKARYRVWLLEDYAERGRYYGRLVGVGLAVVAAATGIVALIARLGAILGGLLAFVLIFIVAPRVGSVLVSLVSKVGAAMGALLEALAGGAIRRRIVGRLRTLRDAGDPDAIELLIEAVGSPRCTAVHAPAMDALRGITQQGAVHAVCRAWLDHRKRGEREAAARFESLIRQEGWVVMRPPELRVYTALLTGRTGLIGYESQTAVQTLLQASRDADPTIAARARELLSQLRSAEAIEFVCEAFLQTGDPTARELIVEAGYLPRDAVRQAAVLFLTEQYERYEALDPDHSLLATAYLTASESLRWRLLDQARRAGRADLMRVVVGSGTRRRLGELRSREWQAILETLSLQARWHDMWRLALEAPPYWSKRLLEHLTLVHWDGATLKPDERTLFEQLRALAPRLPQNPTLSPLEHSLTLARTIPLQRSPVPALEVSTDGRYFITAEPQRILLWDLRDGRLEHSLSLPYAFRSMALHPSEPMLSVGMTSALHFYRVPELEQERELSIVQATKQKFVANGAALACRCYRRIVEIYTADSNWSLWRRITRHSGVHDFALPPNLRVLYVATEAGVSIVNPENAEHVRHIGPTEHAATAIAYLPRERFTDWIALGYENGEIAIYSLPPAPEARVAEADNRFRVTPSDESIASLEWIEPERWLLSVGEQHIYLWQPPEIGSVQHFALESPIYAARYSRAHNTLIVLCEDQIRLYTDPLTRLVYTPVAHFKEDDVDWLEQRLGTAQDAEERGWLEFTNALVRHHWRYDIAVETEPTVISVGEFDIEIEVVN